MVGLAAGGGRRGREVFGEPTQLWLTPALTGKRVPGHTLRAGNFGGTIEVTRLPRARPAGTPA